MLKKSPTFFSSIDKAVQFKINKQLLELVENIDKSYERIAVVCIGTDRSTGDSFGPLVGHHLSKHTIYDFDIYGTIFEPVHALNLVEVLSKINKDKTLIIGVDASLGAIRHVGHISLGYGSIKPGLGVGKELPSVGDIFISGIVNIAGFNPITLLQCTRLAVVYKMAEITYHAISSVLYKKCRQDQKIFK
jgi:putative sporulation protein YyaC